MLNSDFRPCKDCIHAECCGFKDAYKEFLDGPMKAAFDKMPHFLDLETRCKHRRVEHLETWGTNVR